MSFLDFENIEKRKKTDMALPASEFEKEESTTDTVAVRTIFCRLRETCRDSFQLLVATNRVVIISRDKFAVAEDRLYIDSWLHR